MAQGGSEGQPSGKLSRGFLDSSSHTLDAKNRVFLPKRFQAVLESDPFGNLGAVVTRGLDGCLFLFSESAFERAIERLDTKAISGPEARKMQRLFFAHAHRTQLDGSGRILIPEKLRSLAGIDREVMMIGVVERAEIWAKDRWEAYEDQHGADFDKLDEILCGPSSGVEADRNGDGPAATD